MNAFVNDFTDARGQAKGRLLSLSEHLHIVLEPPRYCRPRPCRPTGETCRACDAAIQTRQLPSGETLLKCSCLAMVFAPPIRATHVLRCWRSFRRLKRRAELQLADPEAN
jgi:hypothetical protein